MLIVYISASQPKKKSKYLLKALHCLNNKIELFYNNEDLYESASASCQY